MTKAYSYIRFSSPDQLRGDSLRRQLDLSERFAVERGLDLDESLRMRDLGLSAFTGEHLERGALGGFLEAVRSGRVEAGSFLLVESLDRLSRATVQVALKQFMDIIGAGITIVTLTDGMEYSSKHVEDNWAQLITSLAIMARAHEESAMKSKRIRAAWDRKKREAHEKVVTSAVPAWLKVEGGRIVADPKKAATVAQAFKMVRDGYGLHLLERTLNEQGVPPIGRAARWHRSYLAKMIGNKAVIGEYQPMTGRGSKKAEAGEPVPNYFPRLISDEEFYAAQQAIKDRTAKGGRKGEGIANVFSGLLKCGYCQGPVRYVNKNASTNWQYLVCSNAKSGLGCKHVPWNYKEFETVVLSQLSQLDVEAILKDEQAQKARDELEAVRGKLGEVRRKLKSLVKLAEDLDDIDELATRLRELKNEEAALQEKHRDLTKTAMLPSLGRHPLERFHALRRRLEEADAAERQELRLRLSTELKRFVSSIGVYPDGAEPWLRAMRLIGITSGRAGRFAAVIFRGGEGRIIHQTMATLYAPPPPMKQREIA